MERKNNDDSKPPPRRLKGGLRFAPRVPKKATKIIPTTESHEENKAVMIDKEIISRSGSLRRLSIDDSGSGTKAKKQGTSVQVAFEPADPSVPRTFPTPKSSSSGVSSVKLSKEHEDLWGCTDYPVTLPFRRSYSGDPEILDEEEFGHSSSGTQDGELTAAEEFHLIKEVDERRFLFFQFPTSLPLPRQADSVAKTEAETDLEGDAESTSNNRKRRHGCNLKELPGGHMGKILVYKSGKVKMQLGDALFYVSAGSNRLFAQEVVAIDTGEKQFCSLGEVGRAAIVTPDIDSLLGFY